MEFLARGRAALPLLLAVVATLGLLTSHLAWRLSPTNDLDVVVFDTSVVDERMVEHAVVDRILHHERVPFELGVDHVGSGPGGAPYGEWPEAAPDLVILADAYGVYRTDDGEIDDFGRTLASPTLTDRHARDIAAWAADGVPTYGEFAVLEAPSSPAAAESIEEAFGIRSLGWIARYEEDLSDIPPAIRSLAADAGPDGWPHEGPGILLVATRPDGVDDIAVIPRSDLTGDLPEFVDGPEGGRGDRAPFDRWIELVEPTTATVTSWIELPVGASAAVELDRLGIPLRWPGVLETASTVYVAADGLEDRTGFAFRSFRGGDWLSWRLDDRPDERFFHLVLRPAIASLVDRAVTRQSLS